MLANIMTTPLDIGPLKECGVSHNCINLIAKMLNPDPLLRPDELECLRHPWLVDSASAGEMGLDDNNVGLGEIQEEDDLGLGASRQNESDDACDVADSNVSEIIEVDEIDHEDPRQSKRARISYLRVLKCYILRFQQSTPSRALKFTQEVQHITLVFLARSVHPLCEAQGF